MDRRDTNFEDDDAAGAKIWSVYVSEAEKYDKALVKSWKSDMDGLLIFAGLFSAILTAFLIESYKTLTPDTDDEMVLLLGQISAQLAGIANGSAVDIPSVREPFVPPTSSLICNLLWFISLGLGLSCALTATLVEQWARDFIYKTDMRSSPVIRARIFSHLYYGLKRFNMHAVVEIIPLLLHLSLIFFFAGLIAFLFPVNRGAMILSALLLATLLIVYITFTVFPVLAYDSPYHTPLSGIVWRSVQFFHELWQVVHGKVSSIPSDRDSMLENMIKVAIRDSVGRTARDLHALCWTVRSLADDSELEPFLEGIPDVLWSSKGRRKADFLPAETQLRRRTTALKASWAIATLPASNPLLQLEPLEHFDPLLVQQPELPPKVAQYQVSACAMLYLNTLLPLFLHYNEMTQFLTRTQPTISNEDQIQPLGLDGYHVQYLTAKFQHLIRGLRYLNPVEGLHFDRDIMIRSLLNIVATIPRDPAQVASDWIGQWSPTFQALHLVLLDLKHDIFRAFMVHAATLESLPYQFAATRAIFHFDAPSVTAGTVTEHTFHITFDAIVSHQVQEGRFTKHADQILADLLAPCQRSEREDPAYYPANLSTYLTTHDLSESIVLKECDNLWLCLCLIAELKAAKSYHLFDPGVGEPKRVVEAIWELAFSTEQRGHSLWENHPTRSYPPEGQRILQLLRQANNWSTYSAVALIQWHLLNGISPLEDFFAYGHDATRIEANPFLINVKIQADPHYANVEYPLNLCVLDLRVAIVAEFLLDCGNTTHRAEDTLRILTNFVPASAVTIQQYFAAVWRAGMEELAGTNIQSTLAEILLNSKLLSMYWGEIGYLWLNDTNASRVFIEGMVFVERRDDISSALRTQIETIRSSMRIQLPNTGE
ncbi:hypothetical protein R3P38DRAFT_3288652 [Favolaschia claudopus]|uniref:DUF6535 domain-containing protein n=1 Tax=Favolaschia claudopus TaxID=2862362 RepID=A0AAV9ZVX2_9AGAR